MTSRLFAFLLFLFSSVPAYAASLSINFDLVFDQISLSGESSGVDAPALGNGWAPVDSMLEIEQSAAGQSTLAGTLFTDGVVSSISLTGTFFLDLTFTDIDGAADYGTGLSSPLTLLADPTDPLVVSMSFGLSSDQLLAIQLYLTANPGATIGEAVDDYNANNDPDIAPVIVDPGVKAPLGVDLNSMDGDDAVQYFGESLLLTAAESTSIDLNLNDADVGAALLEFFNGGDATIDIVGDIDVMATGLGFAGGIVDETDPPFLFANMDATIRGSTPAPQAVPAPLTLALLGLGLVGIATFRRL